ncbi:MAG: histidine kinase [Myxococcota bacterium]
MNRWLDTMSALSRPRRAVPIAVVSAPLVFAQWQFSGHDPFLLAVAVGMVGAFVALAPFTWRALFPGGSEVGARPLRLLVYAVVGAIPTAVGAAAPLWLGRPDTFLTRGANTAVVTALFWVGGWGLARDVDLEQGLVRERARADRMRREAERAQLMAINAHLDPHFLFNTLNAIAEWCQEDPAVAERAILQLSSILREVLGGIHADTWPLGRELDVVRDVWALHRDRDPSWFTVEWEVDPAVADQPVPPLVLLPLAENAIKHGPARGHRGVVRLEARLADGALVIGVSNPGPYAGPREGGSGLELVRKRVALASDGRGAFTIRAEGARTVAELRLPGVTGPGRTLAPPTATS